MFFLARNISIAYGLCQIVNLADLSMNQGECVAIVGRNGSGKSTLLKGLAGLIPQGTSGEIFLDGEAIHPLPAWQRSEQMLLLLQGENVFPRFDVLTNLELGVPKKDYAHRRQLIEKALSQISLFDGRERTPAANLSGGEQQILALLRATLTSAKLILLDEPSIGLSQVTRPLFLQLLRTFLDEGKSILMVEQDMKIVEEVSDTVLVLHQGRLRPYET